MLLNNTLFLISYYDSSFLSVVEFNGIKKIAQIQNDQREPTIWYALDIVEHICCLDYFHRFLPWLPHFFRWMCLCLLRAYETIHFTKAHAQREHHKPKLKEPYS